MPWFRPFALPLLFPGPPPFPLGFAFAFAFGFDVPPADVPVVLGATAVVAAGLAIPLAWPTLTGLAVYAVISGLGRGAYLTADLALMLDVLPSDGDHGRDLGVLGLATILPQTLGPAVGGVLLTVLHDDYRILFAAAIVAVLTSMPVVARVGRSRTAG